MAINCMLRVRSLCIALVLISLACQAQCFFDPPNAEEAEVTSRRRQRQIAHLMPYHDLFSLIFELRHRNDFRLARLPAELIEVIMSTIVYDELSSSIVRQFDHEDASIRTRIWERTKDLYEVLNLHWPLEAIIDDLEPFVRDPEEFTFDLLADGVQHLPAIHAALGSRHARAKVMLNIQKLSSAERSVIFESAWTRFHGISVTNIEDCSQGILWPLFFAPNNKLISAKSRSILELDQETRRHRRRNSLALE